MARQAPTSGGQSSAPSTTPQGIRVDLSAIHDDTIIDQTALAKHIGVTTRTIRRMIGRGELPPPVPFARHSVWTGKVLRDHVSTRLRKAAPPKQRAQARIEAEIEEY